MKTINKLITIIQEDIIGTDNRYIAIVWSVCLALVLGLGVYLNSESRSFLGVADSREQNVSFEYPVEIRRMHVIPGQSIRKGELLMELDQSELDEKIRQIRSQLTKLVSEKNLRKHLNLIVSNKTSNQLSDPLAIEIESLTEQLNLLELQKKNLYIFASIDGVVGAVNFKTGERVNAFSSILTLSSQSPSYIDGFIHEKLQTKLEVGQTVLVSPVSSIGEPVYGKVVSIGSRIVQMPQRLMFYPGVHVYGREVVVEIPSNNSLLLGEKVQIKPKFEISFMPYAKAADSKTNALVVEAQEAKEMQFPQSLAKRFQFEPSGVVYLDDVKKFLVVSDDTDSEDSAVLFLVNSDGKIDEQTLAIPGLKKISDLESISQVGQNVYLMTSMGLNKKGKDKKIRNLFVRSKREGLSFSDTTSVEFKPMLVKAITSSKDPVLTGLFNAKNLADLEIEGHIVAGKDLYLGLKNPLTKDHEAVILKVTDFESVFSKKSLASNQVVLWRKTVFKDSTGQFHTLSDLISVDGQIYASSVCQSETCGGVWKLKDEETHMSPTLLQLYKEALPEGLAFMPKEKKLFVTFDQKAKASRFSIIDLSKVMESDVVAQVQPAEKK